MRRIPPAILALAVVVLVIAGAAVLFAVNGGQRGAPLRCSAAQAAGPYGCVTYVSESGTEDGRAVSWLANGSVRFQVSRYGSEYRLGVSGGCHGVNAIVALSEGSWRTTSLGMTTSICIDGRKEAEDGWLNALFLGTVRFTEHDDATVTLKNGTRTAVFQEVLAQR